jgi:hypothetical protein
MSIDVWVVVVNNVPGEPDGSGSKLSETGRM